MSRFYPFIRRALRLGLRCFLIACGVWVVLAILLSFLPVHYSGVMMERQLSAWLSGNVDFAARQTWVEEEDIAPVVYLAVLAAEDQKFPDHWGLDTEAIFSVLSRGGSLSRIRGASTITQQTAKNLFLWSGRSWIRKGLEAGMSLGLECLWSKRRILTVYLNIIEFGDGVFGVEQAARTYFKKPASKLTQNEAALMAAVLPNPHIYRLDAPSAYVKQRQNWILRQMNQLGGTAFLNRL